MLLLVQDCVKYRSAFLTTVAPFPVQGASILSHVDKKTRGKMMAGFHMEKIDAEC